MHVGPRKPDAAAAPGAGRAGVPAADLGGGRRAGRWRRRRRRDPRDALALGAAAVPAGLLVRLRRGGGRIDAAGVVAATTAMGVPCQGFAQHGPAPAGAALRDAALPNAHGGFHGAPGAEDAAGSRRRGLRRAEERGRPRAGPVSAADTIEGAPGRGLLAPASLVPLPGVAPCLLTWGPRDLHADLLPRPGQLCRQRHPAADG
mmetsp:Transcript_152500/g.469683  ORF Transcript_152500/g.469683 Transcript_152500/m.469683 type:complete len:203 (+) Transcript_152500:301-909(+)